MVTATVLFATLLQATMGQQTPDRQPSGLKDRPSVVRNVAIQLDHAARVPARVSGIIAEIHVKPGSAVKKGQVLAKIDDRIAVLDLQRKSAKATSDAAIEEARAAEEEASAKVDDGIRLGNNISKEEMRVRRAQQRVAKCRVDAALLEQQLNVLDQKIAEFEVANHQIISPIDGVVAQQLKQQGEAVKAYEPVFRVMRNDVVQLPK